MDKAEEESGQGAADSPGTDEPASGESVLPGKEAAGDGLGQLKRLFLEREGHASPETVEHWTRFVAFVRFVNKPLSFEQILQLALSFSAPVAAAARELRRASGRAGRLLCRLGLGDPGEGLERSTTLSTYGSGRLDLSWFYACETVYGGARIIDLASEKEIGFFARGLQAKSCLMQGEETVLVIALGRTEKDYPYYYKGYRLESFDIPSRAVLWHLDFAEAQELLLDARGSHAAVGTPEGCAVWRLDRQGPVLVRELHFPGEARVLDVSGTGRVAAVAQARLWVSREQAEGMDAIDLGSTPLAARFSIPGDLLVVHSDQVFCLASADLTLPPAPLVSTSGIDKDDLGSLLDLLARSRYLRPPLDQAGAQAFIERGKKPRSLGYMALSANGRTMLRSRPDGTFLEDEEAVARGATCKLTRSPVRWLHALAEGDMILSASWGEAGLQRWRAGHEESERVNLHDSALRCEPAVSPGGMVASVGQNDEVHLWSAETFLPAWRADALPSVREICLLPNDEGIAVLHGATALTPRERRLRPKDEEAALSAGATALTLLGMGRGEVLRSIRGLPPGARGLRWSPDGQCGALFAHDGGSGVHELYLLELAADRARRASSFAEPIAALTWSDDSRVLICVTLRGVRMISREEDTISEVFFGLPGLEHLATLADRSLLLDSTRGLCLLDHGSGQVRWRVELPWIPVVPYVALSPDHGLFALAHEGEIWVAETASGNVVAHWIGHRWLQGGITFVGHHRIAGALGTGRVVVWELEPPIQTAGREARPDRGPAGAAPA